MLYDGACPLCRREIGVYQGLAPTQPLEFRDISDPAALLPADLPAGLTRSGLLARFHVQHGDGRIESGAHAFIALWERLPYWRWLARLGRLPGVAFPGTVAAGVDGTQLGSDDGGMGRALCSRVRVRRRVSVGDSVPVSCGEVRSVGVRVVLDVSRGDVWE